MDDARLIISKRSTFVPFVLILGFAICFQISEDSKGQVATTRFFQSACVCISSRSAQWNSIPESCLPLNSLVVSQEYKLQDLQDSPKKPDISFRLQNHPVEYGCVGHIPLSHVVRIPSLRRPREVPRGSWCPEACEDQTRYLAACLLLRVCIQAYSAD